MSRPCTSLGISTFARAPRLTYRRPVDPSCAVLSAPFPERCTMNLLFRIVYAAHASGTHHKLALDALRHLKGMDVDLWQRLFLQHAKLYLEGSKAPDNEFKDFKNHVLHTRDGYWGGAPRRCAAGTITWSRRWRSRTGRRRSIAPACSATTTPTRCNPPHRPVGGREQHPPRRRVEHLQGLRRAEGAGRGRVPQHRRRSAAGAELAGPARLPGRGEGQRPVREADRSLRHPARRHRSAGRPRSAWRAASSPS